MLLVGMVMQQYISFMLHVTCGSGYESISTDFTYSNDPSYSVLICFFFWLPYKHSSVCMFSVCLVMQGDKIRRRENWSKWIPSVGLTSPDIGLQSRSQSSDVLLATSIQEVQLEELTSNNSDAEPRRVTSSDELITQSELAKGPRLAETSGEGCT